MLEVIIGIIIFIIGIMLGSFCTLAVYRIPLKQDITHERSYCPNCKHKLNLLDLFPVFSYIFLGGKCRYCNNKIRPRYLILEIVSGIVFLAYVLSLHINIYAIQVVDMIKIFFGMIYICIFGITAGIDLENRKIEKGLLTFTGIISVIYMLYLYILGVNMYRYVIYFIIIICLFVINKIKPNYTLDIIIYMLLIFLYVETSAMLVILIITFILIAVENIINVIKKKQIKPAIGAIFSIVSICVLIIQNFVTIGW